MYFPSLSNKCTTVLLIYDEAILHAAGNETVGVTALEAWFYITYSAERQSPFQISHHGTPRKIPKLLVGSGQIQGHDVKGSHNHRCKAINEKYGPTPVKA